LNVQIDGLEVDELRDVRMGKDVVAAADSPQLEAQRFREVSQVGEGDSGADGARVPLAIRAVMQ
jgi:hypothetical protein